MKCKQSLIIEAKLGRLSPLLHLTYNFFIRTLHKYFEFPIFLSFMFFKTKIHAIWIHTSQTTPHRPYVVVGGGEEGLRQTVL